jgi:hypothetical protein
MEMILDKIAEVACERPRKPVITHYYSRNYYDTRGIRTRCDEAWKNISEIIPAGDRLKISNQTIQECWNEESEEFKAEVKAKVDAEYAQAMKEFKMSQVARPCSLDEYVKYDFTVAFIFLKLTIS